MRTKDNHRFSAKMDIDKPSTSLNPLKTMKKRNNAPNAADLSISPLAITTVNNVKRAHV